MQNLLELPWIRTTLGVLALAAAPHAMPAPTQGRRAIELNEA